MAEALAWSRAGRIAFRFFFVFFGLHFLSTALAVLPWIGEPLEELLNDGYQRASIFAGERLFHLAMPPYEPGPSGSSDALHDWIGLGLEAGLAATVCAVWSVLDRGRPHYRRLHGYFRIYLRFALAAAMLAYGSIKIFSGQFSTPPPSQLFERVGEQSPMGMLWTLMGYSRPYTVFAGLGEALGGALLFFRRTTTLGALVTAGVMSNVVMLNFSYDVDVKVLSSMLLLVALYLIALDVPRLAALLVFNRATAPVDLRSPDSSRAMLLAGRLCKLYLVYAIVFLPFREGWHQYQARLDGSVPELEGNWRVEEQERDGRSVPPLATDSRRWQYVSINTGIWNSLALTTFTGDRKSFALRVDRVARELTLSGFDPVERIPVSYMLAWSQPDWGPLILEGNLAGEQVKLKLRPFDDIDNVLMTRGFHWVNERAFNQ